MLPYIARNGNGIVSVLELDVPMGTTLRAKGMLPLVIASWTAINVAGTMSVSSFYPNPTGARITSMPVPARARRSARVDRTGRDEGPPIPTATATAASLTLNSEAV